MIRQCTVDDIEWIMHIAKTKYDDVTNLDGFREWALKALVNPNCLTLRTDDSIMVTILVTHIHNLVTEATARHYAGKAREIVRMFQISIQWAKENGAKKYHFGSSTKHKVNKLAKILGAGVESTSYSMEI